MSKSNTHVSFKRIHDKITNKFLYCPTVSSERFREHGQNALRHLVDDLKIDTESVHYRILLRAVTELGGQ